MSDSLGSWRRTHTCGVLRGSDAGQTVTLMGWAHRRRDHGGLIFVDLRDRTGLTQCVFNPGGSTDAHARAETIRSEFVLAVRGVVGRRPAGTENPKLATGEIEVQVSDIRILNEARPLPFPIEDDTEVDELTRLTYRYLDLRRPAMYRNFAIRDAVSRATRDYLHRHGFLEVETPFLIRTTPEGARDFLVPSRLNRGSFYALAQSPQLFKQLLMVAGFERYFQIVRCFRDEDLRKDRQPEFTQIDIETSFLDRDDFLPLMEGLVAEMLRLVHDVVLPSPFPRLTYAEAMDRFGSDKPDLRFGLELQDVSDLFRGGEFQAFAQVVGAGGAVKALRVPGAGGLSRKEADDLVAQAKSWGAKGLVWVKVTDGGGLQSPVAKFLEPIRPALVGKLRAISCSSSATNGRPRRRSSGASASSWPSATSSSRRTASPFSGSSTFRSSNGTRTSAAGRPCITRSPRRGTRTCRGSRAIPAAPWPRRTTSCSMARRSGAARSVSISRPCSSGCSIYSASARRRRDRSSASCSTPSSSARLRWVASPSVSIDCRPCWRATIRSGRSSRSPRRRRGVTR